METLPDEVLARVLPFLPAREAVQTCVLGRRWRHLLWSMPVLRIGSEDGPLALQDIEDMNRCVNVFMSLRDRGAPLELCEFKIDEFDECENEPHISLWIQQALLSRARSLSLELPLVCNGFPLDDMHLISKHLTALELVLVELGDKFLDFSSCPVLKILLLGSCNIAAQNISSQSLEQLTINNCTFEGITRARISDPSPVWLQVSDNVMTPLLESMPSLVTGYVRFLESFDCCGKEEFGGLCTDESCENCGDNGDGIGDCLLIKGLSEAESLELVAEPGTVCLCLVPSILLLLFLIPYVLLNAYRYMAYDVVMCVISNDLIVLAQCILSCSFWRLLTFQLIHRTHSVPKLAECYIFTTRIVTFPERY
ncbi:hypothetical protein BAE44_0004995 [Dichanthelium oligosanthes]|uniref:F-box domain-containing protein n=1 Tax=Dichanthelium oligosanthes TaxID=888268 RepID=A0A1E5W985_9POAL|nr:hypothetical protein BAE44_0004995 [Dichanthelium oligosanthes]